MSKEEILHRRKKRKIMQIKPILFSTPMVQAILEGRKKQTRRVVKLKTANIYSAIIGGYDNIPFMGRFWKKREPNNPLIEDVKIPYNVGDIMWVRETWQITDFLHPSDENYGYIYKASENGSEWAASDENWKWKPSIFMPREACRLFLKVTGVRVERLQDISEEDAKAEGINKQFFIDRGISTPESMEEFAARGFYKRGFTILWQSINGEKSWNENPWVWVYDFEKVERPSNF